MYRLLIIVTVLLYIVYWLTVILHIGKVIKITNREIKLHRLVIPFYYWIAPAKEKTNN